MDHRQGSDAMRATCREWSANGAKVESERSRSLPSSTHCQHTVRDDQKITFHPRELGRTATLCVPCARRAISETLNEGASVCTVSDLLYGPDSGASHLTSQDCCNFAALKTRYRDAEEMERIMTAKQKLLVTKWRSLPVRLPIRSYDTGGGKRSDPLLTRTAS